jgi:hypothetical protein
MARIALLAATLSSMTAMISLLNSIEHAAAKRAAAGLPNSTTNRPQICLSAALAPAELRFVLQLAVPQTPARDKENPSAISMVGKFNLLDRPVR